MLGSTVRSKLAVVVAVPVVAMTLAVVGMPQMAFAAKPKPAPIPVPVVSSFTASKATLPDSGGSVVLKGTLKYASSCKIFVSRIVAGFPKSFSCGDSFSKTVNIPANKSTAMLTFSFSMGVKNKTGTTHATPVVVTEAATPPIPAPVVVSFTTSRVTVLNVGGTVKLKASLKYASSCIITVSPHLAGFPEKSSCTSDEIAQTVSFHANSGENPILYTFAVVVINKSGSARSGNVTVSEGAAPPPISFSTPNGSPTTLVFAPEGVYVADDPVIVTVKNDSPLTQDISGAAIGTTGDPADFLLSKNNCGYLTSGQTCSLALQFNPFGAGNRTGVLEVTDASWGTAGASAPLALQGTGVWADATLSGTDISNDVLGFPSTEGVAAQTTEEYVTLSNAGNVPLYVNSIGITGSESTDFAVSYGNCSNPVSGGFPLVIGIGQNCTFGVAFDPSAQGPRSTFVVVGDNTIGTETQLPVQGTGAYSTTAISIQNALANNGGTPSTNDFLAYNFGPSPQETPITETLVIQNTSDVTLEFTGTTITGVNPLDFQITPTSSCGNPGVELAAGESCTVQIGYDPVANTGQRFASLKFGDNTQAGGETVSVEGTAT